MKKAIPQTKDVNICMTIIKKDMLEQFSKVSIRCLKFYFKFPFLKYNFILRLRYKKKHLAFFKMIC